VFIVKQILAILWYCIAGGSFAAEYYVSPSGTDSSRHGTSSRQPFQTLPFAVDKLQAGDTLYVMEGVYHSKTYDSGNKNNETFITLKNSGKPGAPITIQNHPDAHPIIRSDGKAAFWARNVSHVVLDGLTFRGNAGEISREEAMAYRGTEFPLCAYYSGFGIRFKNAHHIKIRNCEVYEFCASGIQVWESDYVTIENNLIYSNTFYNTWATCAVEVMTPKSIDESEETKIIIRGNVVFDNINKVPFYHPEGWVVGPEGFGSKAFSEILDGHGILVFNLPRQIWKNRWLHGRVLIENNLTFNNGFHGIKTSYLDRVDIRHNICFKNGATLLENGKPLKGQAGIFINQGDDFSVTENIVWGLGSSTVGLYAWPDDFTQGVLDGNWVYDAKVHYSATETNDRKPRFKRPSIDWTKADFSWTNHRGPFAKEKLNNTPVSRSTFQMK
jgi:hypothetical protein